MTRKKNNATRALLRRLADELEDKVDDIRGEAGFHALEALEADNQDAQESRERALKLSARASAFLEVIELIRDRCPDGSGNGRIHWTVTAQQA